MKVGRAFHHKGSWWVHVTGVQDAVMRGAFPPRRSEGAVKTCAGWSYFRLATAGERDARLAESVRADARAAQFAAERRAAMVDA